MITSLESNGLRFDMFTGEELWLTRGPGFGTAGAKEMGVPAELLGG